MTKSKWQKKHEFYETSKKEQASRERRNLCRTRAEWLRSLRQDVAIELADLHPGDVIEIRKVRPKKRRDRALHKWRIGYNDSENGYVELLQEGNYSRKYAEKNKVFMEGHGFPERQVWNLCYAFTEFLLPRLKALIERDRRGYPAHLGKPSEEDPVGAIAAAEWGDMLVKMYQAICIYVDNEEGRQIREELGIEAASALEDRGLKLFQEYLFDLWD